MTNNFDGLKRGVYFLTSDEFIDLLKVKPHDVTPEQQLNKYKSLIDKTPNKFLQFHLDWSIKHEKYELSAYIMEVAKIRGVDIS